MSGARRTGGALLRWLTVSVVLVAAWQVIVWLSGAPPYILPTPMRVLAACVKHAAALERNFAVTAVEIVLGLAIGTLLGVVAALGIGCFPGTRRMLLPVLVASQAVPVFAIAPLLVLWLGYGMASKVAMAVLIIFFPVTAAFLDGLRRTEPGWIDLARTMTARGGGTAPRGPLQGDRLSILVHVRVPAALPALGSGMRVATAVAPIGAVVGEWVGSSAGLGYLMLHANGRMQTDLMFAALLVLAVFSVLLWFAVDAALRRLVPWQAESLTEE